MAALRNDFDANLLDRATWFLSYARRGQRNAAHLLSERFKLPIDSAWALLRKIEGGADADAS